MAKGVSRGLISKKVEALDCNCAYSRKEPFAGGHIDRFDHCKCSVRVMKGKKGLVPESPSKVYPIGAIFVGTGKQKARL